MAAKYLYKYVTKGADRAMVRTEVEGLGTDEIEDYQDLRSVSPSEAMWHILGFPIARKFPAVYAMRLHLEDEQQVLFDEGTEETAVEVPRATELTAFFRYNEEQAATRGDGEAELLKYVDFPTQFTYNKSSKKWIPRKKMTSTIGRVHSVSPAAGDVFYLRILLHHDHCKGKVSHRDLMTLPGEEQPCDTYKELCRRLGLLQDDREWTEALTEAAVTGMCPQLRELYVTILLYCEPSNPLQLFEDHWNEWVDDFQRQAERRDQHLSDRQLRTLVTMDIEERLQSREKELHHFGLESPTEVEREEVAGQVENTLPVVIREELDFDFEETKALASERKSQYTPDQLAIHEKVMEHVNTGKPLMLYINARGGCGKTFVLNGILADVRTSEPGGAVALAMGTTGIASNLLLLGRTFHSRMKVPALDPTVDQVFGISGQSALADLIRRAKVLVIDGKMTKFE